MAERLKKLDLENDIPEHVNAIVMACLQKDPGKRPQSMRVIREWIESAEDAAEAETVAPATARQTQKLEASPPATTKKAPAGGSRKKWEYGILAVLAVIVGAALFFSSRVKIGTPIWEFETGGSVDSPPPSVLMARFTSGQMTTISMPSMARPEPRFGNLQREVR